MLCKHQNHLGPFLQKPEVNWRSQGSLLSQTLFARCILAQGGEKVLIADVQVGRQGAEREAQGKESLDDILRSGGGTRRVVTKKRLRT